MTAKRQAPGQWHELDESYGMFDAHKEVYRRKRIKRALKRKKAKGRKKR